ncbi:MAG: NADH-quinone oxidoreductase subunit NuoE [Candidatus Hydrogenedentes bacterium]|nr:NADH-quinone oxidoreductase subunit NuoE [Candidatus Hydrogenedentota bacterium]
MAPEKFREVREILDGYGHDASKMIPILQAVQEVYRYLPQEVLTYIATALGVPPARLYGVATFYAHFALKPKGKYVIRLCDGTACHVKRSSGILDALRRKLGLDEENNTTADMLFTVETVACLGACGLAPVMLINDTVHGQVTPDLAVELVEELIEAEVGQ